MNDINDQLQEAVGDGKLAQVTLYAFEPPNANWGCDIVIYRPLNGPKAGKYIAVPRLLWILAPEQYHGTGPTEQQALLACLNLVKGVDRLPLFPGGPKD